ncbi:hypothetical protein Dxin01_04267 [Deinococcus xinjiangensis]|uniref:Uncharacterized protein n=1 Tax=Deinococcus xinjiangensis TaxID=457454 RepID=A0ABP9VH06_9DEIO
MPKKTSKLPQETMLKIAITGSAGHHTVPVASVAELRDVLQRYLPDLAPYDLQAAAHLVVVQRTSIIAPRWQIRVMGEYGVASVKHTFSYAATP